MQILTLYRIDKWDGAERHNPSEYHFKDRPTAELAKTTHDIIRELQIVICDTPDDMKQASQVNQIRKSLNKLSETEREILGLPRDLGEAVQFTLSQKTKSGNA